MPLGREQRQRRSKPRSRSKSAQRINVFAGVCVNEERREEGKGWWWYAGLLLAKKKPERTQTGRFESANRYGTKEQKRDDQFLERKTSRLTSKARKIVTQ